MTKQMRILHFFITPGRSQIRIHNKKYCLNSSAKCIRIKFVSKKSLSIRSFSYLIVLATFFFLQYPVLAQPLVLQNDDMIVAYEPFLEGAAGEVLRLYPELKQELEKILSGAWILKAPGG